MTAETVTESYELSVCTARNHRATRWERQQWTWGSLLEHVRQPDQRDVKDGPMLFPGTLTGPQRTSATAGDLCLVVLDLDNDVPDDLEARVARLGVAAAVHDTFTSSPEQRKARVWIPCTPYPATDRGAVNAAVAAQLGVYADPSMNSPAQAVYLPTRRRGGRYDQTVVGGTPLETAALRQDAGKQRVDDLLQRVDEELRDAPTLTLDQRTAVDERLEHTVTGWRSTLEAALEWDEGDRDSRGRGWEALLYQCAGRLGALALAWWSPWTLDDAHREYDALVPAEMAQAVPGKFTRGRAEDMRKKGEVPPPPWEDDTWRQGDPTDDFTPTDLEARVFAATRLLQDLRAQARGRLVSPWGLLGAALARVVVTVPVPVVLPDAIGAVGHLNLGVCLVASSGVGKSVSVAAADEVLGDQWQQLRERRTVTFAGPGSGEGLVESFITRVGPTATVRPNAATAYYADEVSDFGAVAARQGATAAAKLTSALTGGDLSTTNASKAARRDVRAGTYRLVATLAVQPEASDSLLNPATIGTGLPQRFVWFSMLDPHADADAERIGTALDWVHGWADWDSTERTVLTVPTEVTQMIRRDHAARTRGEVQVAPLDAHRNLNTLKVAAALAALHGEQDITMQWWRLAEAVMDHSDATRRMCQDALTAKAERATVARGKAQGLQQAAATSVVERLDSDAVKFARWVRRRAAGEIDTCGHTTTPGCVFGCTSKVFKNYNPAARTEPRRRQVIDHAVQKGLVEERDGRYYPPSEQEDRT